MIFNNFAAVLPRVSTLNLMTMDDNYAALFSDYSALMYADGCHMTNDTELVWDAVQTVFLNMMGEGIRLSDITDKRAYLLASFRRVLAKELDRRQQVPLHLRRMKGDMERAKDNDEESLQRDDFMLARRRRLLKALVQLSPRQRRVLYFRFVKGMRMSHIADLLGMNTQSVTNLVHRSIAKLRTELVHPPVIK